MVLDLLGEEHLPNDVQMPGDGAADDGPDSWHYMCEGSVCTWMKDYKNNLTGPGGGTGGVGRLVSWTRLSETLCGPSTSEGRLSSAPAR